MSSALPPRNNGNGMACIFVHAGAGYHSTQNERVHLKACHDAAKAAMALLKNGSSAVDAVEIAIKVLEDREITNAGYGSNLTIDGVVECDAIVVDHHGHCGAAAAVTQVKNPISLARLLLDNTDKPLSLKRVPPNLLVGQGALDYAYEHGISVVPVDFLISPGARSRWIRWRKELAQAEYEQYQGHSPDSTDHRETASSPLGSPGIEDPRQRQSRAVLECLRNEAQPVTPPPAMFGQNMSSAPPQRALPTCDTTSQSDDHYLDSRMALDSETRQASFSNNDSISIDGFDFNMSSSSFTGLAVRSGEQGASSSGSSNLNYPSPQYFDLRMHQSQDVCESCGTSKPATPIDPSSTKQYMQSGIPQLRVCKKKVVGKTSSERRSETSSWQVQTPERDHGRHPLRDEDLDDEAGRSPLKGYGDDDLITDTVGAIAVDMNGNIACGASSGGIGMKHRGRVGPAALIGKGAAVTPAMQDDPEATSVATVTSGTGEHISTTTAASTCNERVYHNLRQISRAAFEECTDDEAIRSFIEHDFMNHSSVKSSRSSSAIGILTVKKDVDGIFLYFGHNTESFALASMHSEESRPVCTMSRTKGRGLIAQGGRAIRARKRP